MKKPVVFFLYPHLSFWNGGSRYVFETLQRLTKKYEIHLCLSKGESKIVKDFRQQGVKIHKIGEKSTNDVVYWLFFPFFLLFEVYQLRKLTQKYQPQVLMSSLFPTNLWAHLLRVKHVQICWEPFAFFYDNNLIESLPAWKAFVSRALAFLYGWLDVLALKGANAVLTLNTATAHWIQKIYGRKPDGLTYMGVDFAHFKPIKRLTIPERKTNRPLLFHSTDFTALKGTKELLRALKKVKKEIPNVLLLISSPHAETLERQEIMSFIHKNGLQNSVSFLGTLAYKDLPQYYSLVDAVVFTGIGDSGAGAAASLSVLEALACGTPVIRSFYTKEEVKDGKTGILVNPHKPQEVSEACIFLLKRSRLRKMMARRTRDSIRKTYTWGQTVTAISEALKRVLDVRSISPGDRSGKQH